MINRTWTDHAACVGHDPEWWFAGAHGEGRPPEQLEAVRICQECPVISDCFIDACRHEARYDSAFGIWAGLTPRQRRAVRKGMVA